MTTATFFAMTRTRMVRLRDLSLGLVAAAAGLLLATTLRAETLIVGVEDNRYLPHYTYENGEYGGFGRAILDAFFTDKGYDYEYRALPVARLFRTFVAGELDFKYPDNALWSKDLKAGKTIVYSAPVAATIDGVSVPAQKLGRPIDEIKLLGTVRGFTAWNWIERIETNQVVLSENDSTKRLVQQAIMGRVDGAYANVDVIQHVLDHVVEQPKALVFDSSLPHTRTHYHLSSIKRPAVIDEFNAWMRDNQALVDQLRAAYGVHAQ